MLLGRFAPERTPRPRHNRLPGSREAEGFGWSEWPAIGRNSHLCVKMFAMLSGNARVPAEVQAEAGELISDLHFAGWTVSTAHYDADSFGNWYVDVCRAGRTIRLVKDRSQYMIAGPRTPEIKAAGLWKGFDDIREFRHALIKWAKTLAPGC